METHAETGAVPAGRLRTWLFNPFHYVAGKEALIPGVALVLITGLVGSLSSTHFDGVLDFHTGLPTSLWVYAAEGLLNWMVMGVLLLLGGKLISRSRVRIQDALGTQALARAPMVVTALCLLLPGYRRFAGHLAARYFHVLPEVQTSPADSVAFFAGLIISMLMIIWMVALMYRGYTVSSNVSGGKAVGVFIAALFVGEVISKLLIVGVMQVAPLDAQPGPAEPRADRTLTVPWKPGEETTYNWMDKKGKVLGETAYAVNEINHPSGVAYQIASKTKIGPTADETEVVVSLKTLSPLAVHRLLHTSRGEFDIRGVYEANRLTLTADTPSGKQNLSVELSEGSYDNEEVLFLIRAFPLKPDYATAFNFAVAASGTKGKCALKVLGEEKVNVPAGEFETYKVELDFGRIAPKMYGWYGKDKPHHLVKYDNGNILCELKKVE